MKFRKPVLLCSALILMVTLHLLLSVDIAMAADAAPAVPGGGFWTDLMKGFPAMNAWLVAVFTFIGLILRASADFVAFLGKQLSNKSASDFGEKLESWSLKIATILGWFGGGTPKAVLDKKVASEIAKKSDTANT